MVVLGVLVVCGGVRGQCLLEAPIELIATGPDARPVRNTVVVPLPRFLRQSADAAEAASEAPAAACGMQKVFPLSFHQRRTLVRLSACPLVLPSVRPSVTLCASCLSMPPRCVAK